MHSVNRFWYLVHWRKDIHMDIAKLPRTSPKAYIDYLLKKRKTPYSQEQEIAVVEAMIAGAIETLDNLKKPKK